MNFNKNIEFPYYRNNVSYQEHLNELIKNGWVNEIDFQLYANLTLDFNIVLTEKLLNQKQFSNLVLNLPDRELKCLILKDKKIEIEIINQERERLIKLPKSLQEMKTSYQPNINTLVQGYLAAVIDVYKSFNRLNDSNHKKELLKKIKASCYGDFYINTLIRFCGFHKIETCEKKITTSSLYGVNLFKEYLKRGWNLHIIPPLVYDSYLDDITDMNMQSYFVRKHFEKVLNEYEGKGRVLVRDINC